MLRRSLLLNGGLYSLLFAIFQVVHIRLFDHPLLCWSKWKMIAVANSFATSKIPGMIISTNNELERACHQGFLHQLHVNVHFLLKILVNICTFKNKVLESLESK